VPQIGRVEWLILASHPAETLDARIPVSACHPVWLRPTVPTIEIHASENIVRKALLVHVGHGRRFTRPTPSMPG
jgi:hypothetical protein